MPEEEDTSQGDMAGIVAALKQRMAGPVDLGGGSTYTPGGTGAVRPRIVGGSSETGAVRPRTVGGGSGFGGGGAGGSSGGGTQSL